VNVVSIGNINLNNASLLFQGSASDIFIVNISGTMTLAGNGFVSPSAAAWDTHVLLNFTGAGTINATGSPTVNATILAPHQGMNLSGTFGSIYGGNGQTITISGGAKIHTTTFVPAPGSVTVLIGAGLLGMRRRR
jgi:choice-of-anchor A domain-containing protein